MSCCGAPRPGYRSNGRRREHSLEGVDLLSCIPVALREHLLSGATDPEHRQVTVAFIHYDGTDELIRDAGADAVAYGLDELVRDVQAACEKHGVTFLGTDADKDGGKIILVAGAPSAVGEDEERMLLAVRAIIDAETTIPVRIGVNKGPVFSGEIGPPYRRTYTVMGDAVNLAARVMSKAEPGQVLATGGVLEASSLAFNEIALEPFMVKGKREPVHAFVVGAPVGAKSSAEDMDDLPLVGREHETALFRTALDGLSRERGSLIEIVGPPGIGKTRLVNELRRMGADLPQLMGTCERYEASTPYLPFRRLFRLLLGAPPGHEEAVLTERLQERVEEQAPALLPWLPLLGVVADIEVPATMEVQELGEEFRKAKLEEVTVEFLARVISEPTLVVIEDVHWMDEASADLLRHLSEHITKRPWLVCVTRRDEETGFSAPASERCTSLHPGALDERSAHELLTAATEESPLRPHDVDALADRSGGNPLFLLELLRAAQQAGSVEDLPGSVEAMVVAQIDRLSPHDRRLLRYASVLGASFTDDLVDALLSGEELSFDPSSWSRVTEFVVELGPGVRRFRHALMRDAAYEGLPYRRRRQLHARAGEAILASAEGSPAEFAELLSLHFFFAGSYERALEYSQLAAERAVSKFANVEAVGFFERAIDAARKVGQSLSDLATLFEALGDARRVMGLSREAGDSYAQACRAVEGDRVRQAGLYLKRAQITPRFASFTQAIRLVRRGFRVLEGAEGREAKEAWARLAVYYSGVRTKQGRYPEAESWCLKVIATEGLKDRSIIARAYYTVDLAYMASGRVDLAVYSTKALAIYEELGNLPLQAEVLNNMGVYAFSTGRWDRAIELYERARSINKRLGDLDEAAICSSNLGEVLCEQGRLDEAADALKIPLRMFQASDNQWDMAFVKEFLGRVAARKGRFEDAERFLSDALAAFEEVGDKDQVIETEARIAEMLLFRGDWADALRRAQDTIKKAEALESVSLSTPLLFRIVGLVATCEGRFDAAEEALEASLDKARARKADYEAALTMQARWRLQARRGDVPDPALRAESGEILERLSVISVPAILLSRSSASVAE